MLQKMKNSGAFSKPFVSSEEADVILGLKGANSLNRRKKGKRSRAISGVQ
eukprot:TRINITY_DN37130_c0_g1_i1.p2 TRINITY_DN37130_c0_g1~~TRINITY_DN37130_c0_g1_i1.p2  ORF type:complete len:50 (+),score=3.29 TRINITY_DN37130_c0_g1_i1:110-259(+)